MLLFSVIFSISVKAENNVIISSISTNGNDGDDEYHINDVIVETVDGVEMGFIVTCLSPKTVQFGGSKCQAFNLGSGINQETSGKVRIPSEVRGFQVTRIAGGAFFWCENVTEIEIPETIIEIEENAFYCCAGLKSLHIPASVEIIEGARTFWRLAEIESITVADENKYYSCPPGSNCLIENATGTLLLGCKNSVIPNSVRIIGPSSFSHQKGINSIDIPEGVNTIGDAAFYATGLRRVGLPNSLTTIESIAFGCCFSLNQVNLPQSLEYIGDGAFHNCILLGSIIIPAKVNYIEQDAFLYCPLKEIISLRPEPIEISDKAFVYDYDDDEVLDYRTQDNATLYVPIGSKEKYEHAAGWKLFKNIEEMDFSAINSVLKEKEDDEMYYNLSGLRLQSIPNKGLYIYNGKKLYAK